MKTWVKKFYKILIATGSALQPFFLLAIRLFWGWQFLKSGMGKLMDIHSTADFFSTLNIPTPLFNAYLAALTEALGGFFLILGFASRLVSIPLMFTMIVALSTAHREAVMGLFDDPVLVVQQTPFSFFMAALIVFIFGPGTFSIDGALKRMYTKM